MTDTREAVARAIERHLDPIDVPQPHDIADVAISAYRAALEAEGFVVTAGGGQAEPVTCRCGAKTAWAFRSESGEPVTFECSSSCRPTDPGVAAMREGEL